MLHKMEDTLLNQAAEICLKWACRLSIGFHPDTRGADYSPALTKEAQDEYDADMSKLWEISEATDADPYEIALEASERFMAMVTGKR